MTGGHPGHAAPAAVLNCLKYVAGRTGQASQTGRLEPLAMPLARMGAHRPCMVGHDCNICSQGGCLLLLEGRTHVKRPAEDMTGNRREDRSHDNFQQHERIWHHDERLQQIRLPQGLALRTWTRGTGHGMVPQGA